MATITDTPACAWCRDPIERMGKHGPKPLYCSNLHRYWAIRVDRERYPKIDCPRCGRRDLCIAGPDWAICQTCGYQTDRPDLPAGVLTPRNMNRSMSDIKNRLAHSTEK